MFIHFSRRTAALVSCPVFLLASALFGQAQIFNQVGGDTNAYNFYGNDINTGNTYGTDPSTPYSGTPLFAFTSLPTSIPAGGITAANALGNAIVNVGNGISNPFGIGTTVTLTDTGSQPDEVRLDWDATYVNVGTPFTPAGFDVNVFGTDTGFAALAGGVTISDSNNRVVYTATIGVSPSTPLGTTNYGPLGPGAWDVNAASGSFNNTYNASVLTNGPAIANGDVIQVQGFLELALDPGTMEVVIEQVPEPGALALPLLGGLVLIVSLRLRQPSRRPAKVS